MPPSSKTAALCGALTAVALLSACAAEGSDGTPTTSAAAPDAPITPPPTPTRPQTKNWFDLTIGDCLTEIPDVNSGAVTTTVVDCATPHLAEVFLLAPLAVNTAIDEVAMQKCGKGFVDYTGQSLVGGPFAVTYLIDSNQDRTQNNPTPSTAICFLRHADDEPLTESERF